MGYSAERTAAIGMDNNNIIPKLHVQLKNLLPIESGDSVQEVESHPIFRSTKSSLLRLSDRAGLVSDVLSVGVLLLDHIQKHDHHSKVKDKNVYSISSLLIVTKLISQCIEVSWSSLELSQNLGHIAKTRVPIYFAQSGYLKPVLSIYKSTPDPIDTTLFQLLFNHILNLRSQDEIQSAMRNFTNHSVCIHKDVDMEIFPYRIQIQEIDDYCSNIIRYLSVSNWNDLYHVLFDQLNILSVNSNNTSDIIPYIDYLSYLNLNTSSLPTLFHDLSIFLKFSKSIKNKLYRALVLSFLSNSIEYWFDSNPKKLYELTINSSLLSTESTTLFESIYTIIFISFNNNSISDQLNTDTNAYSLVILRFLSLLVCFTPPIFDKCLSAYSLPTAGTSMAGRFLSNLTPTITATTTADSKKIKLLHFLKSQLSEIANNGTIISYLKLISITNIGIISSYLYEFDSNLSIIKFFISLKNDFELIFNNKNSDLSTNTIRLYCQVFTTYSTILPNYIKLILNNHLQQQQQSILKFKNDNDHENQYIICYISTALRVIAEIPSLRYFYNSCLNENSKDLRFLISKHSKLLLKFRAANSLRLKPSEKTTTNSESVGLPILTNAFYAFIPNPLAFFEGFENEDGKENDTEIIDLKKVIANKNDIDSLITCLVDIDPDIVKSSTQYINVFYNLINSLNTKKLNQIMLIYTTSGYIINSLSTIIFENDNLSDEKLIEILKLINKSFKTRSIISSKFNIKSNFKNNDILILENFNKRQEMYNKFESIFLLCLCLPNLEIFKNSINSLYFALEDSTLSSNNNNKNSCPLLFNIEIYKDLCPDSFIITGQVALQKKIRSTVIQFIIPTDGIKNSWLEINKRFKLLKWDNKSSLNLNKIKSNYAGMLTSLCDCILLNSLNDKFSIDLNKNDLIPEIEFFLNNIVQLLASSNIFISNGAKDVLSKEFSFHALPYIFKSIQSLIERITTPNKNIVNDLTQEVIFRTIDQILSLISSTISRCSQTRSKLITNILTSLILILKYLDGLSDYSIDVLKLKIGTCKALYILSINRDIIQLKASQFEKSLAINTLLRWFDKSTFYNVNDLETSSFLNSISSLQHLQYERRLNELDYLLVDLSLESIKAVSSISKDAVIQVLQNESDSEENYLQAKSAKFGIIFVLLLRGLEKYEGYSTSNSHSHSNSNLNINEVTSIISNVNGNNSSRSSFITRTNSMPYSYQNSNSNSKSILNNIVFRSPQSQKSTLISKFIVKTLTNTLTFNSDVGLKFCLPVGYHKNNKIRSDVLKVFANIIQQGAISNKLQNNNDNEYYYLLMEFLLDNLTFCIEICSKCPATEIDELATSLLDLYETQKKGLILLKALVSKEISNSNKVVDLLRRNSVATKMLSLYAKKYGNFYLENTLTPLIKLIIDNPDKYVFELNSDKLMTLSSLSNNDLNSFTIENVEKFITILTIFIKKFKNSLDIMPSHFKDICQTIHDSVALRFPEAAITSVGSFIFLRFLCPVIVAPTSEGLDKNPPQREVRRSLLLLAKVIQNMANGTMYALKLPLLSDRMNDLNKLNEDIIKFLKDSTICGTSELKETSVSSSTTSKNNDHNNIKVLIEKKHLFFIHEYLYNHWDDINASSNSKNKKHNNNGNISFGYHTGEPRQTKTYDYNTILTMANNSTSSDISDIKIPNTAYQQVEYLLEAIGKPKVHTSLDNDITSAVIINDVLDEKEKLLNEFMTKVSGKDFGPILEKQLIHEGIGIDGKLFLIVSWGMFDSNTASNSDLLVYRIFKVLLLLRGNPFSIFFDCSGFNKKNVSRDFISKFRYLCPLSLVEKATDCCCYNVSSEFISLMSEPLTEGHGGFIFNPFKVPHQFYNSYNDNEDLPFGVCNKTRNIINDGRINFTDVSVYNSTNKQFEMAEVTVGQEYVQIHLHQPVSLPSESNINDSAHCINTLDVYHATDLTHSYLSSDVIDTNTSADDNEFTIGLDTGSENIILTSPIKADIVRSINSTIQRYIDHSSTASLNDNVFHSINDIICILHNLIYSAICAEDPDVRTAGYNLAYVVEKTFNSNDDEVFVVPTRDSLFVPKNNILYMHNLSKNLVKSFPNLTYGFIKGFFEAYKLTYPNRKDQIILYVAPWIHHIYSHVFLNNDEGKGSRRTKYLIREFLKISFLSKSHIAMFHEYIWEPICETEELTSIVVSEVISSAIDKRNDGGNCEEVISILSSCQSYSYCEQIIKRLINLSSVPIEEKSEAKALAHTQSSWAEIIVLIKALLTLSFDSLEICKSFFPEMIYVGTIFLNKGPRDVRDSIQKLIINSFQVLQKDESLDTISRARLSTVSDKFTGQRANLLFGLNKMDSNYNDNSNNSNYSSDDNYVDNQIFHTVTTIETVEKFTGYFFECIDLVGKDEKQSEEWKEKIFSMVINTAFKENSTFRSRAFLVMGILSKLMECDVEQLVSKVAQYWLKSTDPDLVSDPLTIDLNICIIECLKHLVYGLSSDSYWLGKLFWLGIIGVEMFQSNIFISGTKLAMASLECMHECGRFSDGELIKVLTNEREIGGECLERMETVVGIRYSPGMFDNYIRANLLKGLLYRPTRAVTMDALARIMSIEVKNLKIYKQTHLSVEHQYQVFPVLYLDCLQLFATDNEEVYRYASILEKKPVLMGIGYGQQTPRAIFEMFGDDNEYAIVSGFIELSIHTFGMNDGYVLQRFLGWLVHSPNIPIKFIVIAFMHKKFEEILEKSTSLSTILTLQEAICQITTHPDYKRELHPIYLKQIVSVCEKYGFLNLRMGVFTDHDSDPEELREQFRSLKGMLARALGNETSF